MTCFYHAEGHFKSVYVLMQNSFRCTMIGRYRHTIPEAPNFDSNSLLYQLDTGNCAIAELLTTCRHSGFWQNKHIFYCVSNCF